MKAEATCQCWTPSSSLCCGSVSFWSVVKPWAMLCRHLHTQAKASTGFSRTKEAVSSCKGMCQLLLHLRPSKPETSYTLSKGKLHCVGTEMVEMLSIFLTIQGRRRDHKGSALHLTDEIPLKNAPEK